MSDEFQYDVFISYSSKDKDWVRGELLERLEQAGLKVFIDFRDFDRGAPSLSEMERGVRICRKTLAVLTPDYIASEWCEIESTMTQILGPANRQLRLIPLLKAPCDKPLRINALTHVDFTDGADRDLAWRQLLTALGKPPTQEPPKEPKRDNWFLAHPYPMPPNFTGRITERSLLTVWLNADPTHPLLVLRALGGFGKSALAWHWLMNDVSPATWPRVVWWSFYEGDASFEHFLAETLNYLSQGTLDATKMAAKDAVRALLTALVSPGTLLILDGFERVLRAFSGLGAAYQGDEVKHQDYERGCISPLADEFLYNVALNPQIYSKVLLTTRLLPRILEARGGGLWNGCREYELQQMQPEDAVEFFHQRGVRGHRSEIETACAQYGYHPLSLCLLAGLITEDPQQPGDIVAAQRLDVSGDLVQRQHHVLETAYDRLSAEQRELLGRIACFRSPVTYDTLRNLSEATVNLRPKIRRRNKGKSSTSAKPSAHLRNLAAALRDLVTRGLLHHDRKEQRFDLHPIVRCYAYDRIAAPERTAAHTRLRDYFAAVPRPDKVTCLDDLAPIIELYHHTVRAGEFDKALELYRNRLDSLYFQLGAYQLIIDLVQALFPDGNDRPSRLSDESESAWALNELAIAFHRVGQPRRSIRLCEQKIKIDQEHEFLGGQTVGLVNLASTAISIGNLQKADQKLGHSIRLSQQAADSMQEATATSELGWLHAFCGAYAESEVRLQDSLKIFEDEADTQCQCLVWSYFAQRELLRLRSEPSTANGEFALRSARRALELADETSDSSFPHERDYIQVHWLLGAAQRVTSKFDEAEGHLQEALQRCRRINLVELEADILIDLVRLRAAQGVYGEAQRLAEEALAITERCGYVLQGADVHLELAKLAWGRGQKLVAREHAQEARKLATCDGPPDYTYKAAYEEAGRLLQELD